MRRVNPHREAEPSPYILQFVNQYLYVLRTYINGCKGIKNKDETKVLCSILEIIVGVQIIREPRTC